MQAAIAVETKAVGCVVYYGMPENDQQKLENFNCDVLGIFAEEDKWIDHTVVSEYESAMKEADKKYETHWFDAAHAFANPSNAKYVLDEVLVPLDSKVKAIKDLPKDIKILLEL